MQENLTKQESKTLSGWLLTLVNKKSLLIVVIACLSCFIAANYQIRFSKSTILYSLVISFPLIFSIQEAFKRREKALEYLSSFKASMQVALQSFHLIKKISPADIAEIKNLLQDFSKSFLLHLQNGSPSSQTLHEKFQNIFLFMYNHKAEIGASINMKILKHLENAYSSLTYLSSQKKHGTMVAFRKVAYVFINFFPVMQAPVLFEVFGKNFPVWVIYLISVFSSLLLIMFYQIQEQIEDPFDQVGLDDICLSDFKLTIDNLPVIKSKKYADND